MVERFQVNMFIVAINVHDGRNAHAHPCPSSSHTSKGESVCSRTHPRTVSRAAWHPVLAAMQQTLAPVFHRLQRPPTKDDDLLAGQVVASVSPPYRNKSIPYSNCTFYLLCLFLTISLRCVSESHCTLSFRLRAYVQGILTQHTLFSYTW